MPFFKKEQKAINGLWYPCIITVFCYGCVAERTDKGAAEYITAIRMCILPEHNVQ